MFKMQHGKAWTGGNKIDNNSTKSIKLAGSVCGSQASLGSAEKIHWWALIFPVVSLSILLNGSCWQGNWPPFSNAGLRQRHPLLSCESQVAFPGEGHKVLTAANMEKLKKWESYERDDYGAKNDGCPKMPAWYLSTEKNSSPAHLPDILGHFEGSCW